MSVVTDKEFMPSIKIDDIIVGKRHRKNLGDLKSLTQSIGELGLLHPIVINKNRTLIAGHRRLKAFKQMERSMIPATIIDIERIVDGERAENFERKDFLPSEKVAIQRTIEHYERKAAKERQGTRTDLKHPGKFPESRVRDTVAQNLWSGRTGEKAQAVVEAAEAEPEKYTDLVEEMDRTNRVNGAYKKLRKRQRAEDRNTQSVTTFDGTYRVLYADPPWAYADKCERFGAIQSGGADTHYPSMSIEELCGLADDKGHSVKNITTDDAVLFLWITSPLLPDCFEVIKAWGFTYKASFVWDKVKHNRGYYNSVRHELLLICTRGSCLPDSDKLLDSVVSIERGKHSEKPQIFREIIDSMYIRPKGLSKDINDRIELFARTKHDGWDVFGDDIIVK